MILCLLVLCTGILKGLRTSQEDIEKLHHRAEQQARQMLPDALTGLNKDLELKRKRKESERNGSAKTNSAAQQHSSETNSGEGHVSSKSGNTVHINSKDENVSTPKVESLVLQKMRKPAESDVSKTLTVVQQKRENDSEGNENSNEFEIEKTTKAVPQQSKQLALQAPPNEPMLRLSDVQTSASKDERSNNQSDVAKSPESSVVETKSAGTPLKAKIVATRPNDGSTDQSQKESDASDSPHNLKTSQDKETSQVDSNSLSTSADSQPVENGWSFWRLLGYPNS